MKDTRSIIGFTAAYIAGAIALAVIHGNREFVFYIVIMFILIAVIAVAHRRTWFSPALLWCLSIWGLLHMAGGLLPVPANWPINGDQRVLYSWWIIPGWLKYDQLIHVYGFGVTTWLCWQGLRRTISPKNPKNVLPTAGRLVLCAAAGMGFGALNEVVEFIATLTLPSTNVGGYRNTGWDLVSNLVGVILATSAIAVYHLRRKS